MKLRVLPQVARTHMRPARAQTYFVHRNLDRLTEDPNAHPGQLCTLQGNFRGISLALLKARHHINRFPLFSNHVAIEVVPIVIALDVQSTVAARACRGNLTSYLWRTITERAVECLTFREARLLAADSGVTILCNVSEDENKSEAGENSCFESA